MAHPLDARGHKKVLKSGRVTVGGAHMITIENQKPQQLTVRPRCGVATKPVCVTHGKIFASEKELRAHLADKGDHVTAEWCGEVSEEARGIDPVTQAPIMVTAEHGLESDREIEA